MVGRPARRPRARCSTARRARRELLARVEDRGLSISALTCNGNQLDPVSGPDHDRVVRDTIALAPRLGVDRVILMSGCPGGPGDKWANWITVVWPPEAAEVLRWQWEESVIPYWQSTGRARARSTASRKLCIEMHGQQVVYNVPTLHRLREAVGPVVGANYDPSHLMWMGADPIAAIDALGDAIYHVHAKDTRIEPAVALRSRLETSPRRRRARVELRHARPRPRRHLLGRVLRRPRAGGLRRRAEHRARRPVDGPGRGGHRVGAPA